MANFLATKKGKRIMGMIYGIGAAIVIIGALFKILHWKGANEMLMVGLLTEAGIFFISAFEKPHEEPDWSLVYPELAGMHDDGDKKSKKAVAGKKDSITQELDKMLEDAKVGPELIESLGNSLKVLSENTSKLADITDASVATDEYVSNIKTASKSVESLSHSYIKASESLTGLTMSNQDGATYGEQLQKVSKNLAELNSIYELQLSGAAQHTKATSQLYEGLELMMSNLNASIADTQKYKEEIAQLSNNLSSLNTIYGNMLNAMSFKN
ncbi:MAG: gliding motility protein GldL [Flavobacteriales bacterium]